MNDSQIDGGEGGEERKVRERKGGREGRRVDG